MQHHVALFLKKVALFPLWVVPFVFDIRFYEAKTFYFIAPFLAMAKLKQAWLCSSGLTKTFYFKHAKVYVFFKKRERLLAFFH